MYVYKNNIKHFKNHNIFFGFWQFHTMCWNSESINSFAASQ